MQKQFDILKQLLSGKRVSLLIVLLAITARIIQLIFYLDSFFDTSFQVIATQNFVAGHGISTAVVNPGDLSATIYQPLVNWPPGYSLLLTPFYIAAGHNYLIACLLLDILAATAIILLTRRLLQLLDVSLPVINLFTLLTGFFIYYFFYTGSTDSISIAFFLAAVTVLLAAIKTNRRWMASAVATGVFLLLSASLKYLFFPVVFILPVFLFVYGYQNRSAQLKKASLVCFGIVAAGIAALYLYQQSRSGTGAYISSPGRGFFPEHLLRAHPFIPAAFLTPNTIRKLPAPAAGPVMDIFRLIHVITFLAITVIAIKIFFQSGLTKTTLQKTFFFLAWAVSLAISLVLLLLSLLVDKELMPPDRWWTYAEDARYYGLGDILLHLSVFLLFYHYRYKAAGLLRYVLLILPFLLVPEAIRGIAFTANRVIKAGSEKYYWQGEKAFFEYGAGLLKQKQDSLHVKKAVISGSLYYGNYRASLHQQLPVMEEVMALNNPAALKTKEPVLLLAIIRDDRRPAFQQFINYPSTELAGQSNGFYFYTLYVAPE